MRWVWGKESYRYDGHGRRVQVSRDDGSKEVFQYGQAGQYLFSSKLPAGGGQTTHENVYLSGSVIATIDHNWPSNAVTAIKYQHTDALGSPVATTNTSGALIERTNYEPYGSAIGKTVDGIGYTGHVMDGSTGLTYMQQRYYDPTLGRFLSVDPVTANFDTGGNFNRYWYANNSPYAYRDPDGRAVDRVDGGEIRGPDTIVDLKPVVVRPLRASTGAIVVHRTVSSTAASAINTSVAGRGVPSFHIVIDTDGTTTQISNLNNIANHVGVQTTDVSNLNSIGIEVVGRYNGLTETWDPLTPAQIEATAQAVHVIGEAYGLRTSVFAHENVSRKTEGEGGVVMKAIGDRLNQIRIRSAMPPPLDSSIRGHSP